MRTNALKCLDTTVVSNKGTNTVNNVLDLYQINLIFFCKAGRPIQETTMTPESMEQTTEAAQVRVFIEDPARVYTEGVTHLKGQFLLALFRINGGLTATDDCVE